MNVFYLDRDPVKAANDHCDKHCVKMILEYAQLRRHDLLGIFVILHYTDELLVRLFRKENLCLVLHDVLHGAETDGDLVRN